ncbi:MAG: hypothetical protein JRI23_31090 [Deltaproteobacteria bacterium]|jgi:hypothetical protein|nr:hypothetical protein [Deltaproteobacteria bacterium]MBW2536648.1 hypothetical protein [Deltaproteobacteria bacterium]
MDTDPSLRNRLLYAGAGGVLAAHAAYYFPFLSDDALISLRYARRFAGGLGLTWTDGERVEGYTDLGWVLIHAASAAVGFDPIASVRAVGLAGALAAILAVSVDPGSLQLSAKRLLTGGLVLALTTPLAVWAIGGLEHGFMAGLLAVGLLYFHRLLERERPPSREVWGTGLLFALLAVMRADGILLFALAALGALLAGGLRLATWGLLARMAVLPAAFVGGQLLFRLGYYGELVPNTALVKVSLTTSRIRFGLDHVLCGAAALNVLWIGVLVSLGACIRRAPRHRYVVPLTVTIGWWGYVAFVGGDIFPGWRQLLLGIVPLALLVADGASHLKLRRRRARLAAAVLVAVLLGVYPTVQTWESENVRAKEERWEWDGYGLALLLKQAFGAQQPLVAVDAAGAVPYWSELPALDMLGLNDKHIATHRPKHFGRGPVGHELGDGAYLWQRRPDLLIFNNASGADKPVFLGGRQLLARRDFGSQYQRVRLRGNRGNGTVGIVYLRFEKGVLGIDRSDDRVSIPGYLLSGSVPAGAQLTPEGTLATPISAATPGRVERVRLPKGTWEIALEPPVPDLDVAWLCRRALRADPRPSQPKQVAGRPALRLHQTRYVDLVVALPVDREDTVWIERAVLSRTSSTGPAQRCELGRGPIEVPLQGLSRPKPEGTSYAHPTNVVMQRRGVRVTLPVRMFPTTLELSVDCNDSYRIRYESDGELLDSTVIEPPPEGRGLAVHRVRVPEDVQTFGVERILVVPHKGDDHYSLGHLRLFDEDGAPLTGR